MARKYITGDLIDDIWQWYLGMVLNEAIPRLS
jgi:hypothetical protein